MRETGRVIFRWADLPEGTRFRVGGSPGFFAGRRFRGGSHCLGGSSRHSCLGLALNGSARCRASGQLVSPVAPAARSTTSQHPEPPGTGLRTRQHLARRPDASVTGHRVSSRTAPAAQVARSTGRSRTPDRTALGFPAQLRTRPARRVPPAAGASPRARLGCPGQRRRSQAAPGSPAPHLSSPPTAGSQSARDSTTPPKPGSTRTLARTSQAAPEPSPAPARQHPNPRPHQPGS
ncbi:hypothetical protein SAMN05421854_1251, partial [Amycolatopsis rubida]